ncbi:MAG: restriction endonuclease [Bacteroidetes bacterium]|nr:restriction endonuclease [Bacteroidota bacterium]MBM3454901.1 restriction endonuclease [Bacteroidota bacterium]
MDKIDEIILAYNLLVKGIESRANNDESDRAYGGIIRAGKGMLVENITKLILEIAWLKIGGNPNRISFEKQIKKLPIRKDYINELTNSDIRKFILENIDNYYYSIKTDVHCNIDGVLVVGAECKAYTENAMMKRILVDFTLMKQAWPNLNCFLIQLESQLGGDYSSISKTVKTGSPSTHTLFSYFDVDLKIVTLLEGERKVDKPIHKSDYYKELTRTSLESAIHQFEIALKKYL